jgi:chromosome partitioning protein
MLNLSCRNAHIIAVGNEKGGTGKSTIAMHLLVSLEQRGLRVGAIDLDARQQSLARYLHNRAAYAEHHGNCFQIPNHQVVAPSASADVGERERDEAERLDAALEHLDASSDFIVIDCPGGSTHLAQRAHALADTLLTPLNDSFVDLDLLGRVNPDTYAVEHLSCYAEAVWEGRKLRNLSGLPALDWVVCRNRISTIFSKNRERVDQALTSLQKRLAFRYLPGLSERVIYRELFPKGLTLMDLTKVRDGPKLTLSHVAARHEFRTLVNDLRLPGWND